MPFIESFNNKCPTTNPPVEQDVKLVLLLQFQVTDDEIQKIAPVVVVLGTRTK